MPRKCAGNLFLPLLERVDDGCSHKALASLARPSPASIHWYFPLPPLPNLCGMPWQWTIRRILTFPQFRGPLVKPLPSSLRTRPGSHSQGSSDGAADYRTP